MKYLSRKNIIEQPVLMHFQLEVNYWLMVTQRYNKLGSGNGIIRLWDVKTGVERQGFKGHTSYILALSFSSSGKHLASASSDTTIRLWDTSNRTQNNLLLVQSKVYDLTFTTDQILAATTDDKVIMWDLHTG